MADGKVRNLNAFRNAKRKRRGMEWEFLRGCFDYGIMPTDIDGCIERNGHYLFFEEKHPGIDLGRGQQRLLHDLNVNRDATIFIIWGDTEIPYVEEMSIWRPFSNGKRRDPFPVNIEILKTKCRQWFKWVDSLPPYRR